MSGVPPGPIGADEVHVWTVDPEALTDPALLERYEGLLSDDERARRDRFRFERGRHECLVTRALVRTTLSRYVPVAPERWRFVANRHGAPALAPGQVEPPLRFNLAHTRGLIACAVTVDRDVGVDVEWTGRRGASVALADHFFSPSEARALRALPAEQQRERFFRLWTLKESYIKARGMGLAIPLDRFSFRLDDGSDPIRIELDEGLEDEAEAWQFALWQPTPAHRLAVGVRRGAGMPDLAIRIRESVPLAG